ncbi:hypothetical protein [Coraliomargarita akajimensis]|uniref:Uncharacterized protein n=1 Tax=Coraliomargarita akajimensis (strain DSM 45221 / IAM 15411 / JCM 23193 / KCTC 12865 / 04OKA010-24) TaxID=583355 RepID=D5EI78_CORAD|nr:hypothetical protein [Coraliomargarita akajimensis]ADE56118.1 hypothetical protein Caka_3105 [Coraliomargarita akajimensis DSM 45221]
MKPLLLSLLFVTPFLHAKENEWDTQATQLYSNASSYQFYSTFELLNELLKNEWNESIYERTMLYLGYDMLGMKKFKENHSGHSLWEPWFEEKIEFQTEILELLHPLIEKKRSGKTLSEEDLQLLSKQRERIQQKLLQ